MRIRRIDGSARIRTRAPRDMRGNHVSFASVAAAARMLRHLGSGAVPVAIDSTEQPPATGPWTPISTRRTYAQSLARDCPSSAWWRARRGWAAGDFHDGAAGVPTRLGYPVDDPRNTFGPSLDVVCRVYGIYLSGDPGTVPARQTGVADRDELFRTPALASVATEIATENLAHGFSNETGIKLRVLAKTVTTVRIGMMIVAAATAYTRLCWIAV